VARRGQRPWLLWLLVACLGLATAGATAEPTAAQTAVEEPAGPPAPGAVPRVAAGAAAEALALEPLDGSEVLAGRIIVGFRAGTSLAERADVHRVAQARGVRGARRVARVGPRAQLVDVSGAASIRAALDAYWADPRVGYAEPDRILRGVAAPDDPDLRLQNGLQEIDGVGAWRFTEGSPAVTVAVLDCGIWDEGSGRAAADGAIGHPDIRGKVVARRDFTGSASGTDDRCDHGTHVAGLVGAATNNGLGIAGLGHRTTLINARMLDDTGAGTVSQLVEAIHWSVDNGARVLNMSFSADGPCSTAEQQAIDDAWSRGVVVVAAAGNAGSAALRTPASCRNVLAVAADTGGLRLESSSYGTWVDVSAPGYMQLSLSGVDGYARKSGTSMAAAHVAGLAALVWASRWGTDAGAVVERITGYADAFRGTGELWTHGRINARAAVWGDDLPPPAARQLNQSVAFQVDPGHAGAAAAPAFDPPLRQRWAVTLRGGAVFSYPLVVDGRVFALVGNETAYAVNLYAFDAATGAVLWGPKPVSQATGLAHQAYDDGKLFVLDSDGYLRAFEAASGGALWTRRLSTGGGFREPPVAARGMVFAGGAAVDGSTSTTLYAVRSSDGEVLWRFWLGALAASNGQPTLSDDGVSMVDDWGNAYKLDLATGALRWHRYASGSAPGALGAFEGGRLHAFGRVGTVDGAAAMHVLDEATGAVRARFPAMHPGAFADGVGVFLGLGAHEPAVNAFDVDTGERLWQFVGDRTLTSPPIVVGSHAYAGSANGRLYALDLRTGEERWAATLGRSIAGRNTIGSYGGRSGLGFGAAEGIAVVPVDSGLVALEAVSGSAPTGTPTRTATPSATPTPPPVTATPTATPAPRIQGGGSVGPTVVAHGQTVAFDLWLTSDRAATGHVSAYVWDAATGVDVFQDVWHSQGLGAEQPRRYETTWSVGTTPAGRYRAGFGVWDEGWETNLYWTDLAELEVVEAGPTASPTPSATTAGTATPTATGTGGGTGTPTPAETAVAGATAVTTPTPPRTPTPSATAPAAGVPPAPPVLVGGSGGAPAPAAPTPLPTATTTPTVPVPGVPPTAVAAATAVAAGPPALGGGRMYLPAAPRLVGR
jgi:thermitase